jgi:hypothetical protein
VGYYGRGDYYRRIGARGDYYGRGDPGLFSFVGKALKTVGSIASVIPGVGPIIGTAASVVGGVLSPSKAVASSAGPLSAPAPAAIAQLRPTTAMPTISMAGGGGAVVPKGKVAKVGVSPMGTLGIKYKKSRRMNAGNAKAARRAIRRIKAVRHLLQGIERELPHRRAIQRGSRGVITRSEAARALRA